MKKTHLLFTFLLALFAVACSKDDPVVETPEVPEPVKEKLIMNATDFNLASEARSSIKIEGTGGNFSWTGKDTVGVFLNQGGQVFFQMTKGAGSKTVTFEEEDSDVKFSAVRTSYYPYCILNNNAHKVRVNYEGQTQVGNNSNSHLSSYDFMAAKAVVAEEGQTHLNFGHLNCLVELDMQIPEPMSLASIVLSSPEELFVTEGEVDLTQDKPIVKPAAASQSFTVAVTDLTTTMEKESVKVYMMMAPVNLKGKEIIVKVGQHVGTVAGENLQAGQIYQWAVKWNPSPIPSTVQWIDLGLSVKWASHNIGASKPEEYGDHFAWGEIETKESYTRENSVTHNKPWSDIAGNPKEDVATAKWGASVRMPTMEEMQELVSNCTFEWITIDGVNGYKCTSKRNQQSIFLPAAGRRYNTNWFSKNSDGRYWASTPDEINGFAMILRFDERNGVEAKNAGRSDGLSVRPVKK